MSTLRPVRPVTASAGGPIFNAVAGRFGHHLVCCAHSLLTGNLVISADDEVRLKPSKEKSHYERGRSGIFFDMDDGDEVIVKRAPYKAKFVRFTNRSFFALLQISWLSGLQNREREE